MGRIGKPAGDAVPALLKTLNDKNKRVRIEAASALKKIGTPEAMKAVAAYEKQGRK